jgi:hypothetical protein
MENGPQMQNRKARRRRVRAENLKSSTKWKSEICRKSFLCVVIASKIGWAVKIG